MPGAVESNVDLVCLTCTIKASQNRIPGFACVRLEKWVQAVSGGKYRNGKPNFSG